MGVVVEAEVPSNEFALQKTITELDDLEFEVERIVAHDPDQLMPFVWVSADKTDSELIQTTLENDPSTANVELLVDLDDEWLYQMNWVDSIQTLVQIIVEEEGTILAAFGREGTWHLRALFPERGAISRTNQYCTDNDLTFDIKRMYRLDEGEQGRFGLTDQQQETLETAFENGYFEIPQAITMDELAKELEISPQALSERLHRAHKNLIKNAIMVGRGAEGEGNKS
ncbi:helix-turn-helix domain-containing protein [Haladaptatus sp. CMAA 1911]|uniref:helix-turn-helix domain-containing protein n=1 Tax=unclassified Haladaptatus TaxID=2622732 RepID=UPI00375492CD